MKVVKISKPKYSLEDLSWEELRAICMILGDQTDVDVVRLRVKRVDRIYHEVKKTVDSESGVCS